MHLGEETVCSDQLFLSASCSNGEVERRLGVRNGMKYNSEIIIEIISLAADLNSVFYKNLQQQQIVFFIYPCFLPFFFPPLNQLLLDLEGIFISPINLNRSMPYNQQST